MFILRFFKKRKLKQIPIFLKLVSYAIFTSLCIYLWSFSGCVGFPGSYFCSSFSPKSILKNTTISTSLESDFRRLIDLNNFTFLINNFACNEPELLLLVLVHSRPQNFLKRSTIRSTWGTNQDNKFKLLFMLGLTNSTAIQKRLYEENKENEDIVQGNFVDSYRNLTYKHVMVLKWYKYFCSDAKYLLKTDDDVFINTPKLLKYLEGSIPETGLMRCMPIFDALAKRSWRSKWRVSFREYKYRFYPPYCMGFAILYSSDVALNLYEKAQRAEYFWIDDVFITGFLALSANYTPSTFGKLILKLDEFYKKARKGFTEGFTYLVGPYSIRIEEIRTLWKRARQGTKKKIIGLR